MSALRAAALEFVGLFVEDWPFALAIALWLAAIAVAAALRIGGASSRGVTLFAGLAVILLVSVVFKRT